MSSITVIGVHFWKVPITPILSIRPHTANYRFLINVIRDNQQVDLRNVRP
jgi:hypothetical protein